MALFGSAGQGDCGFDLGRVLYAVPRRATYAAGLLRQDSFDEQCSDCYVLPGQPDLVLSYMKKQGYTFPVIVNTNLEIKLFPTEGGIPKTFVVGPAGRRAQPFKSWTLGRILLEVDKVAKTI